MRSLGPSSIVRMTRHALPPAALALAGALALGLGGCCYGPAYTCNDGYAYTTSVVVIDDGCHHHGWGRYGDGYGGWGRAGGYAHSYGGGCGPRRGWR